MSTAGVVTSAAAVMVGVFACFATLQFLFFKQFGVGLAVGDPARRDDHPRGAPAGDDEAARRVELVPAALARVAAGQVRAAQAGHPEADAGPDEQAAEGYDSGLAREAGVASRQCGTIRGTARIRLGRQTLPVQ